MPSFTTHCLAADVAIAKTQSDYLRKIVNKYHAAYMNGCQGPDAFWFYHIMPIQSHTRSQQVHGYGRVFHRQIINGLFENFLKQVKQSMDEETIAYVAGFLTHQAVDANCHPYVYYSTGSLTKEIGYRHEQFETQLDLACLQMLNLTVGEYKSWKQIKAKNSTYQKIGELWYQAVNQLLPEANEPKKSFVDTFKDMHFVESVLADPKGTKEKLIEKLENWVGYPGRGASLMVPVKYDDQLDAFNYRKDTWHHPVTNQPSNADFGQLFNNAVADIENKFLAFDRYLNNQADIVIVLDTIGNRNYDTGLETGEFLYFKADQK